MPYAAGGQPSAIAQGLNPPAPDLDHAAEELSAAELFWITKNGIRMTGMPAWAPTHSVQDLWSVVAFIQTMPGLNGDAYREMLAAAEGHGHHATDADDHGHDEASSAAANAEHRDGTTETVVDKPELEHTEETSHDDEDHAH